MTRTSKYSVSLTPAADEALAKWAGESGFYSRSGALSRAVERYAEVCRRSIPALSREAWSLICDSLNGVIHDPPGHVAFIPHEIADSIRLDKLDAKWGVDGEQLLATLAELDYAGLLAVTDVAERFWAAHSHGEKAENVLNAI